VRHRDVLHTDYVVLRRTATSAVSLKWLELYELLCNIFRVLTFRSHHQFNCCFIEIKKSSSGTGTKNDAYVEANNEWSRTWTALHSTTHRHGVVWFSMTRLAAWSESGGFSKSFPIVVERLLNGLLLFPREPVFYFQLRFNHTMSFQAVYPLLNDSGFVCSQWRSMSYVKLSMVQSRSGATCLDGSKTWTATKRQQREQGTCNAE
jgi:hypothetical protein